MLTATYKDTINNDKIAVYIQNNIDNRITAIQQAVANCKIYSNLDQSSIQLTSSLIMPFLLNNHLPYLMDARLSDDDIIHFLDYLRSNESIYGATETFIQVINHTKQNSTNNGTGFLEEGNCILHSAILQKYENSTIIQLLGFGVNPNTRNQQGQTMLHVLFDTEHSEKDSKSFLTFILELIDFGCDINAKDNTGKTPFLLLLENKTIDIRIAEALKCYIDNTTINLSNQLGRGLSLLHVAVERNSKEIIEYLCQQGATMLEDSYNQTPLFFVKTPEIAKLLIAKYGAESINKHDKFFNSILCVIANNLITDFKNEKLLLLLKYILSLQPILTYKFQMFLQVLYRSNENTHKLAIDLIECIKESYRFNDYHIASLLDDLNYAPLLDDLNNDNTNNSVQSVTKEKQSVNDTSNQGFTPVHLAKTKQTLEWLKNLGADVNAIVKSPIHKAPLPLAGMNLLHIISHKPIFSEDSNTDNLFNYIVEHIPNFLNEQNVLELINYLIDELQFKIDAGVQANSISKLFGQPSTIKKNINTALHFACCFSNVSIIAHLTEKGANITAKSNFTGANSFILALKHISSASYFETINFFIDKIDENIINDTDDLGNTALHYTSLNNATENEYAIKVLIEKGANVNAKNNTGMTSLHFASKNGSIKTMQALINAGADVTICDNDEMTALHFASMSGSIEAIKILLPPDPNNQAHNSQLINAVTSKNITPIYIASQYGHFGIVKCLIEDYQAIIDIKDKNGVTPFMLVAEKGDFTLAQYFVQYALWLNQEHPEHFNFNEFINIGDYCSGLTALHKATKNGHLKIVQYLLTNGADINALTIKGATPLFFASKSEIKKYLVDKGAEYKEEVDEAINLNISEPTKLLIELEKGNTTLAQKLIQSQTIDLNETLNYDITALHLAVQHGFFDIAKLLIEKGALINVQTTDGITPFLLATSCRDIKMAKLLLGSDSLQSFTDKVFAHKEQATELAKEILKLKVIPTISKELGQKLEESLHIYHFFSNISNGQNIDMQQRLEELKQLENNLIVFQKYYSQQLKNYILNNFREMVIPQEFLLLNDIVAKTTLDLDLVELSDNIDVWENIFRKHLAKFLKNPELAIEHMLTPYFQQLMSSLAQTELLNDLITKFNASLYSYNNLLTCKEPALQEQKHKLLLNITKEIENLNLILSVQQQIKKLETALKKTNAIVDDIAEKIMASSLQKIEYSEKIFPDLIKNIQIKLQEKLEELSIAEQELQKEAQEEHFQKRQSIIETSTKNWEKALHIASQQGDLLFVQYLHFENAQMNAITTHGFTALHLAVRAGHYNVVHYLVDDVGIDINATSNQKETALHIALKYGASKIAKFLIAHGANIDTQELDGTTPLYLASKQGLDNKMFHYLYNQLLYSSLITNNSAYRIDPKLLLLATEEGDFNAICNLFQIMALEEICIKEATDAKQYVEALQKYSDIKELHKKNICIREAYEILANIFSNYTSITPLHLAGKKEHLNNLSLIVQYFLSDFVQYLTTQPESYLNQNDRDFIDEIKKNIVNKGYTENYNNIFFSEPQDFYILGPYLVDFAQNTIDPEVYKNITLLHLASQNGHTTTVNLLLKAGAFVNATNNTGITALHLASQNGHVAIVKILLQEGASVCATSNTGITALHLASQNGHVAIVKILLQEGALLHITENTAVTASKLALDNEHLQIFDILDQAILNTSWESGVTNTKLLMSTTAVEYSLQSCYYKLQSLLLSAIEKRHTDIAKELFNHMLLSHIEQEEINKNTNEISINGAFIALGNLFSTFAHITPLHLASYKGNITLVKYFLEDVLNNFPLAIDNSNNDLNPNIQRNVIEYIINQKDRDGMTALHASSQNGFLKIVEYLCKFQEMLHMEKSSKGCTPLHLAANNNHDDIVMTLIEFCKQTVFANDDNGFVNFLHAEYNIIDNLWVTALHLTSSSAIIKTLLAHGADIDRNYLGYTALSIACLNRKSYTANYLIKSGANILIQEQLIKNLYPYGLAVLNEREDLYEEYLHKKYETKLKLKLEPFNTCLKNLRTLISEEEQTLLLSLTEAIENKKIIKYSLESQNYEEDNLSSLNSFCNKIQVHFKIPKQLTNGKLTSTQFIHSSQPANKQEIRNIYDAIKTWKSASNINVTSMLYNQPELIINKTNGETLLHFAAEHGRLSNVKDLINYLSTYLQNMEEKLKEYEGHETLDSFINSIVPNNNLSLTPSLILQTFVNSTNYEGYTPLHKALKSKHYDTASYLIEFNANDPELQKSIINLATASGTTALHLASQEGNVDIVKILIQYGADVNATDQNNSTPIFLASRNGHLNVVEFLIEENADIFIFTNLHNTESYLTPLYVAAEKGYVAIVKLLLKVVASYKSQEIYNHFINFPIATTGYTALHIASRNGYLDLAKRLLVAGASIEEVDIFGNTPLHVALQKKHEVIARYFIDNLEEDQRNRILNTKNIYGHDPLIISMKSRLESFSAYIQSIARQTCIPYHQTEIQSNALPIFW